LLPPHINKDGAYQPPAFYGDGSPIPREYLDSAVEIIKYVTRHHGWAQRGSDQTMQGISSFGDVEEGRRGVARREWSRRV
jgi:hypothetical protein